MQVSAPVMGTRADDRFGRRKNMTPTNGKLWGAMVLGAVLTAVGASNAQATITSTNTTNDSTNVIYAFQYSTAGSFYRTYVDADSNAGTGFAVGTIGADYLLEDGFLYHYVGPGWIWSQIGAATYSNASNTVSWAVPRTSIGETNCTTATANVVFQVELSGGTLDTSGTFGQSFIPCSSALTDNVTTNDATNVYYDAQYTGSWSFFQVFIDTDRNAATGYSTGGLGADYFVENGTLYQHTGGPSSWTWNSLGAVTYSNNGTAVSWAVPRAAMGETQTNETANLLYRLQASGSAVELPIDTDIYFGGGAGGTSTTGTIVPLYSYPTASAWSAIISAKTSHPSVPVVAIVNPSNGPGTAVDSNYTSGIANLQAAGIVVIGYVATGYAGRAQTAVQADVAAWKSFYPAVTGIFFDEMSNQAADVAFYQAQDSYARGQGFTYTVGNPGTDTIPAYVGVVNTILVYESSGLSTLPTWYASYPASNFVVIPYNVPSLDASATSYIASARQEIGYIYLTDDNLPNPWDTLASYFASLLTDLQ
jgi:hypothetical protein